MQRVSCWIYPNNEIRIRQSPAVSGQRRSGRGFAVSAPPVPLDIKRDFQTAFPDALKQVVPGDKPGYGGAPRPTQFGLRGKRTILRVGGVIDRASQPSVELTGTLPGSTPEAMDAIARYSGYLVNCLMTWANKRGRHTDGWGWFYVWERQRRGALHLHVCITSKDRRILNEIRRSFANWWFVAINRVSQLSAVDLAARGHGGTWANAPHVWQCHAQFTKKSVAAYYAKYCSKASGKGDGDGCLHYYPTRWWGCSRGLLGRLRDSVCSFTCVAGGAQAAAQVAAVRAAIGDAAVSGYQYRDKFGPGITDIVYVRPDRLSEITEAISQEFRSESMSTEHSYIFRRKFMPSTEYLTKIWSNTKHRTAFFESLNETNRDMVYAWANSRLSKNWISLIENAAFVWYTKTILNTQTNAEMRHRAKSEASLAEQLELGFPSSPAHRAGERPAPSDTDYLPPALRS